MRRNFLSSQLQPGGRHYKPNPCLILNAGRLAVGHRVLNQALNLPRRDRLRHEKGDCPDCACVLRTGDLAQLQRQGCAEAEQQAGIPDADTVERRSVDR